MYSTPLHRGQIPANQFLLSEGIHFWTEVGVSVGCAELLEGVILESCFNAAAASQRQPSEARTNNKH